MPEFLTFTLTAPLAAMGEIAVGERRSSWDRPGRSAVLGLIAGCMGLTREDEAAHNSLETGYGLALRVQNAGPLLPDYHTAQVPPVRRGRRFSTRAEELGAPDLETILSRRDYRTEVMVLTALWNRPGGRWSLTEIEEALLSPRYAPYFGRKSCPLMLPMAPQRIEAANPVAALSQRANAGPELERQLLRLSPGAIVTMTASDAREFALPIERIEVRRDALASRRRWQFTLREEAVLSESL
ncbi:MAG TPA: type I-E CRISPR-associated protein Cas5/CasD [Candidatus Dormibacteraeota bacterium]|nr:type I-E CRISPR-associated protein Cas5/CasD [Candidatus Dormibacteraeota bacterium]